jgi:glycosyltransferase involved in cell wall biosynthesis
VILSVGRLDRIKDQATLLRAFARLRANCAARLMILGEGDERARLESLAQELGIAADVTLPGFVANPMPYMRKAAVFALSSLSEGFGNVLVEALYCGCPVISTECGGPREILMDGRYGHLVPVGDDAALAKALAATLTHPPDRQVLIQSVQGRGFTVAEATERYLQALQLS